MAVWVTANLAYSDVLRQVAPLEAQLGELKAGLADSNKRLVQCQEELGGLDEQVRGCALHAWSRAAGCCCWHGMAALTAWRD